MVLVLLHDAEDAGWRLAFPQFRSTQARAGPSRRPADLYLYGRQIPNSLP